MSAYTYRVNKEINKVDIYVAKEDIPARTEITDDLIEKVSVASSMLSNNVIRDLNNIKGKIC
ncbi:MAG: SAF domain-containing protein [Clostridium sp.]|nr:MAG: SAF domain-containing protein [Clostridium sp.]